MTKGVKIGNRRIPIENLHELMGQIDLDKVSSCSVCERTLEAVLYGIKVQMKKEGWS